MKRKILLPILIFAVSVIVFFLFKPSASKLETTKATRASITDSVMQSGNVNAAYQSTIHATSTGVVDQIYVQNNQAVLSGQKLLNIKSTSTEKDRALAQANYAAALSTEKSTIQSKLVNQQQLELARKAVLDTVSQRQILESRLNESKYNPSTGKAYTQEEIDSIYSAETAARENFNATEKKYLDSDFNINSARSNTSAALAALNATKDTTVTAPIDGTVVNLKLNRGDNTTAASSQSSGTEILNIANFDSFSIKVSVNESTIPKINLGQPANIILDAFPDKVYTGRVTRIDDIGKQQTGLVTYDVEIAFDDPDATIRSGMTANVEIETDRKDYALVIPASALRTNDTSKIVQLLMPNGKINSVPVKIGIRGAKSVEILSGIKEGDTVVLGEK